MRIVVLANDVVPGMGIPVAAPGLRAWGIALGLRGHGHDVTVLVDERVARRAWTRAKRTVPPPQPPHTLVAPPSAVAGYVRKERADVLIVTNSNHVAALGDLGSCRLVYDFFAPKMLELAEQAPPEEREQQLEALERRKLAALGRSDAVIVNGAKKLDYVRSWLRRAGRPDLPTRVTNMALPPVRPRPPAAGPVQAIVTGYLQPWSTLGPWVRAIRPFLDDGTMNLHILIGTHWGQPTGVGATGREPEEMPRTLGALADHPAVVRHREMRFGDFQTLMSRCHLSIDVFERNPERELAMVTRSAVALSCGLPVMHVPFTEVSPIIEEHGAGWLVEETHVSAQQAIFRSVVEKPSELEDRRRGAVRAAHEVFEPVAATQDLHELLGALR